MKYMIPVSLTFVAVFAFTFSGCGSNSTEPTGSSTPAADGNHADHEHGEADHDHSEHAQDDDSHGSTDMDKMNAELAKLSPEDAASAGKQHICPVSGEMLGTMGAPKKVDMNGQQVWVCCDGCKDKLLASPDQYLAKLQNK